MNSLKVVNMLVEMYKNHPSIIGITPINEPSDTIPWMVLSEYYWRSYQLVRQQAPDWIVIFHDSFRLTPEYWGKPQENEDKDYGERASPSSSNRIPADEPYFLKNCDHYAVDTHLYFAWSWDDPLQEFVDRACKSATHFQDMETRGGVPIIVGEWSLASDNCAMWLNGLNDNGNKVSSLNYSFNNWFPHSSYFSEGQM
jgi:glucan 1,3-beta-glucosidase